jgi:hypothetical protein
MTNQLKKYLEWRCRMNWHTKYRHLIDKWIDNVLPYQCEYFEREMNNLINRGIYNP